MGARHRVLLSLEGGESLVTSHERISQNHKHGGELRPSRAAWGPSLRFSPTSSQLLCSEWPLISCPVYLNWQQPRLHPVSEAGHLLRLSLPGTGLELEEVGDSTPRAETLQKQRLSRPGLSRPPRVKDAGTASSLKNC